MVLDLVPEEGTRAVDLLTSDNGDLLASEDLIIEKKCQRPSVDQLSSPSPSPSPFSCLARILKSFLSTLTLVVTTITRSSHTVQDSTHFLRKYSQKH